MATIQVIQYSVYVNGRRGGGGGGVLTIQVIQYSVYVNGRRGKMEGGGGGTHGYNTGHSVLCVCEWKMEGGGGGGYSWRVLCVCEWKGGKMEGGGGVLMATIQVIQYSVYVNGKWRGGGGTHGYNTGHSVLCVCEWKERENGGGGGTHGYNTGHSVLCVCGGGGSGVLVAAVQDVIIWGVGGQGLGACLFSLVGSCIHYGLDTSHSALCECRCVSVGHM